MKKLIWLCSSPTPYNDCLFGALNEILDLNLEVVYREFYLYSHPWQRKKSNTYRSRQLSKLGGFDLDLLKKILFEKNITYVVGGWHPKFWCLILALSLKSSKFIVWSDTPNDLLVRGPLKEIVRNFWLKLIFKNSHAILGTGSPCVDKFISMGADKSKVFNFPLWIPLKPVPHSDKRINGSKFKVISIGRLESIKGLEYLVKAANIVKKINPLLDIQYKICGDGPLRNDLETLIEAHSLTSSFIITGWLEHDVVLEELESADIYVHPAIWEPYGAAVLEAMAAGLPILGSDNTMAVLDRVEADVTGFIHETGNVEMLADQIVSLLSDPILRSRLSLASYNVSRKFPVEFGVKEFLKIADIE